MRRGHRARGVTGLRGSILGFLGVALLTGTGRTQAVWTKPLPIYGLAGAGDILAAATAGGVVLWDLSGRRTRSLTVLQGLPSNLVLAVDLFPGRDELCVATTNGMARGWFDLPWRSIGARNDESGWNIYTVLGVRAGRCFAGGEAGLLLRWDGSRVDSLRIPSPRGRVLSLALFTTWLAAPEPGSRFATLQHTGEPIFPVGLAAAVDNDGVWLLRASGSFVRWLRFVQEDGLPSHRTHQVLTDSHGRLWAATDRGIAWIDSDLRVHSLASQPLGGQRTTVLLEGDDGFLYAGTDGGLVRIDLTDPATPIESVAALPGPIVALALTQNTLWMSDGESIRGLGGDRLDPPASLSDNFSLSLLEERGISWIGHPAGHISMHDASGWLQLGVENGLPRSDITHLMSRRDTLFVGTATAGLYAARVPAWFRDTSPLRQQRRKVQPDPLQFDVVPGTPSGIAAQVFARGLHWIGGEMGLFVRRGTAWEHTPLWPGATQVADLCAAGDTLWVSAGSAGVGFHDGRGWIVPAMPAGFSFTASGQLSRHRDGRIALATDRGLLLWNGLGLTYDAQSPDRFLTALAWWGDCLACGSHQGLWLRSGTGMWDTLGVFDGLPGARIRALQVDAAGRLWIASTRGVGVLDGEACFDASEHFGHRPFPPTLRLPSKSPGGSHPDESLHVLDVRGRIVYRFETIREREIFVRSAGKRGARLPRGIYFVGPSSSAAAGWRRVVVLR